mmetsp:Transcript_3588/g.5278  ORF Transcript_3588/g.5278 Transcript_3588/m.5278 type:complete len:301 (-) Transcript_3588:67-969(-)
MRRYITRFELGKKIIDEKGIEYVVVHIEGASFLFNQIRKMIGMVIAVALKLKKIEDIQKSFEEQEDMWVPRTPGMPLMVAWLSYESYNKTKGKIHGEIEFSQYKQTVDEITQKIETHISQLENTYGTFQRWLCTLNRANFAGNNIKLMKKYVKYTTDAEEIIQRHMPNLNFAELKANPQKLFHHFTLTHHVELQQTIDKDTLEHPTLQYPVTKQFLVHYKHPLSPIHCYQVRTQGDSLYLNRINNDQDKCSTTRLYLHITYEEDTLVMKLTFDKCTLNFCKHEAAFFDLLLSNFQEAQLA